MTVLIYANVKKFLYLCVFIWLSKPSSMPTRTTKIFKSRANFKNQRRPGETELCKPIRRH